MPAKAGIQLVEDINNFRDLDSRFRGNDGVFPITTRPPKGRRKPGVPDGHELAYHSRLLSKISKMTLKPISRHQRANLYSGRQITE
jgi:hypothetical protein